jgi:inorganic pyrophosphatase
MDFWTRLDHLIASSEIVIDRPKGSIQPRYPDIIYPFDYGYLKDTSGGDGDEIDICRGTLDDDRLTAIICTIDTTKRDTEIKLIIGCTKNDMIMIDRFFNNKFMSGIIISRPNIESE